MTERLERIRREIRDMKAEIALVHAPIDPIRVLDLLEDLRQAVEIVSDQSADIANNRLPPLERGAPHLQGER